ncbi:MAG TPA: hypothetical protein VJH68_05075, partial [Candidatus Nanoarchaeia archaeon]|nr:hypothetical protein [Candidatus Nanoarchaeia archaeon]
MTVFINITAEQAEKLLQAGFVKEEPKTVFEVLRLKKEQTTAILYYSGKLLLQGKNVDKIAVQLRKLKIGAEQVPEPFQQETGWVIGSDESLKGDTFGGIVVAAVKANSISRKTLSELGVADSKVLSDKEVLQMSGQIKKIVSCEIKSLLPEEYNQRDSNVTELLNKLHRQAANDLQPGKHIVDKYPGCTIGD